MFYQLYELNHASVQPARAYADAVRLLYSNPLNPFSHTQWGRSIAATAELFERTTRRYGKPQFGLTRTTVDWKSVPVTEKIVWSRPFCNLIHFERGLPAGRRPDRKLLVVAPMSGHYATLLRGTVEAMLPACRGLHHRLGRRPHGAADRRQLRPRRLYRLPHRHAACAWSGHPRDGGLPAFGAGARRGCHHGGARRPLRAGDHDADGRTDRHAPQSDRRQPSGRGARHRLVPRQCHHAGAVAGSRLHAQTSIRASCSCPAS